MADTKTSALTALTTPAVDDLLPIVDTGTAELKHIRHDKLALSASFTPTLIGSTTPGAQTYSGQYGNTSRIGNLVYFDAYVLLTAKDAAMAGSVLIGGLPYQSASASPCALAIVVGVTLASGYWLVAHTSNVWQAISLQKTNGLVTTPLVAADISSSTQIMVSGHLYL